MKRIVLFGLVLALAATAVGVGSAARTATGGHSQSASQRASKMNITLKILQGVTVRHQHPPAGDQGDVFSVELTLLTVKNDFDAAPNTRVGNMSFSYLLHGSCSVAGNGCKGTVDIDTTTKLPGGTITAGIKGTPIRQPFVVKINGGTGKFKGATGTVVIAPDGAARNVYNITLP